MLDDLQVFRAAKLGDQGATTLFDEFSEVYLRLTIPSTFLSATSEYYAAALSSRKDVGGFTIAVRRAEVHLADWLLRAFRSYDLTLCITVASARRFPEERSFDAAEYQVASGKHLPWQKIFSCLSLCPMSKPRYLYNEIQLWCWDTLGRRRECGRKLSDGPRCLISYTQSAAFTICQQIRYLEGNRWPLSID